LPEACDQPFVSLTLADLYWAQGHRGPALKILQRLLAADPGNQAAQDRLEKVEAGETATQLPEEGAKEC
jgi:hypothetical protein